MKSSKKVLERYMYAYMLLEHFYALDAEMSNYIKVNGREQFDTLFPDWDELADNFIQSIWKLLKEVDPTLANIWDRTAYSRLYGKEVCDEK